MGFTFLSHYHKTKNIETLYVGMAGYYLSVPGLWGVLCAFPQFMPSDLA